VTQFFEHAAVLVVIRLVVVAAAYFFLLAVTNIVWMRLSCRSPRAGSTAMVSVLIPARNEEKNIGRCLDSLLAQTHANYEIIVLDDQSTDGTWSIIEHFSREHPGRVTAIRGRPLPENGWHGKPHALHQLAERARGEYLLFTDADTVHASESISWAVTNLESHRVDFLSAYTGQELGTFGESLLVPIMYLMTAVVMPIWMVTVPRASLFSFAIGQFVMIRRETYRAVGGYEAISHHINDDIAMARLVRRAGFRSIFLDARRQVRCRMYYGFRQSFHGLTRCIGDFLNRRIASLVSASAAIVLLFILPYVLLLPGLLTGSAGAALLAASVILFQITWCIVIYDRGLRWYVPFLYPATFLFGLVMFWRGYGRLASGTGLNWKGRVVK
jgi:chlorobactene glucosyltransferase